MSKCFCKLTIRMKIFFAILGFVFLISCKTLYSIDRDILNAAKVAGGFTLAVAIALFAVYAATYRVIGKFDRKQ